jgi:acetyl esterase
VDEDERQVLPGQELTAQHRAALDVVEHLVAAEPPVRVVVYRPKAARGPLPLVLEIHGGGFTKFHPDSFPAIAASYAMLGAVVVDVDYRLAPEHPFPAATDDCYAALCWAVDALDVDPQRVVVTGGSAGGALAAAVALMARDRGGPFIAVQALKNPVLDDRLESPSQLQFFEAPVFGGRDAIEMWHHYLGEHADRSATSPYAAPARATDLVGLPPAFIQVNELDPLRDEGIAYATRLLAAGVTVELYCTPRQHHGATEDAALQAVALHLLSEAIRRAIS